jgi:hypothetical protein
MASHFAAVKFTSGGFAYNSTVTVDGKAIDCRRASYAVDIDSQVGVLTLEIEGAEVDLSGVYEAIGTPENVNPICEDCSHLLAAKHAELKES